MVIWELTERRIPLVFTEYLRYFLLSSVFFCLQNRFLLTTQRRSTAYWNEEHEKKAFFPFLFFARMFSTWLSLNSADEIIFGCVARSMFAAILSFNTGRQKKDPEDHNSGVILLKRASCFHGGSEFCGGHLDWWSYLCSFFCFCHSLNKTGATLPFLLVFFLGQLAILKLSWRFSVAISHHRSFKKGFAKERGA